MSKRDVLIAGKHLPLLIFALGIIAACGPARADQITVLQDGPYYAGTDSNSIALLLHNIDPRQAVQLTLQFDPELMVFRGARCVGRLAPNIDAVTSDDGAGTIRILLFDEDETRSAIMTGTDQIVDLVFGLTLDALPNTHTTIAATAALAASDESPPNLIESIELTSLMIDVVVGTPEVPSTPSTRNMLFQNAPNPFNPATTIHFETAAPEHVRIRIYDLAGRLVCNLLDQPLAPGAHSVKWYGRDNDGRILGSGLYFYRLDVGNFSSAKKMMFTK